MPKSFIADPKLFQALEQRSMPVPCSKGRILFNQGEVPVGLYLLKTGKASLIMKTDKGEEVVHLTVCAGSILGLPAIVSNEPCTLSAMAYHGSEVNFLAREDFEELIQAHRRMVREALRSAEPSSSKPQRRRLRKLVDASAFIDRVLIEYRQAPVKQHHTARRIWQRLCADLPGCFLTEWLFISSAHFLHTCRLRTSRNSQSDDMGWLMPDQPPAQPGFPKEDEVCLNLPPFVMGTTTDEDVALCSLADPCHSSSTWPICIRSRFSTSRAALQPPPARLPIGRWPALSNFFPVEQTCLEGPTAPEAQLRVPQY